MAWEQIGTYAGIPFWADDSLGLTDQDVQDNYLSEIVRWKDVLVSFGLTASQAFLKDGAVFVVPTEIKDDPRWLPRMHWKIGSGPNARTVPAPDNTEM